MAPSPYPFGLRNAAATYALAYASTHAEPSEPSGGQRFALDFSAGTSAYTRAESSEEDEAWAGADFSGLCDPEAMRRFMAASDYCFGYSDSEDEGNYNPTRECFHVGLGMPRAGDEDAGAGNRSPPREGGWRNISARRIPGSVEREPHP